MTKNKKLTLDNLWSKCVKAKAGNKCEICGSTYDISPHHFVKRRFLGLRWIIENGFCLCQKHHHWAETHPEEFEEWAIRKRKRVWFDNLELLKRIIKPILDYKALQTELKREIENIDR